MAWIVRPGPSARRGWVRARWAAALLVLGSGRSACASEQVGKRLGVVAGARNHRKMKASILDLALVLKSSADFGSAPLAQGQADQSSSDQGHAGLDEARAMPHLCDQHNRR